MNSLFFIVVVMIFSSCCDTHIEVSYEYNGVIIRRVDECGVSTFYYGDISDKSPKVWVEYSGINDGFSGYLVFSKKGKVMLLSGDGYFQSANNSAGELVCKRIAAYERPTLGNGVYYVMLGISLEKERNMGNKSGVQVFYDD